MKILPIIIVLGFLACTSTPKENQGPSKDKTYPEECSSFFPFQNNVLDLEDLVFVDAAKPVNGFYTDCSSFAPRFNIGEEKNLYPDGKHYNLYHCCPIKKQKEAEAFAQLLSLL